MKQNHNFQNQAFASVFEGITSHMPSVSFFGIIAVYLITASLNSFFLSTLIPTWLAVGLSACIQYGRYAIVFTDFLNPTGFRSPLPYRVALFATIAALAELGVSASHFTSGTTSAFWALFLSGGMVITLGYFLEISFLEKGSEAFGLTKKVTKGATGVMKPEQGYTKINGKFSRAVFEFFAIYREFFPGADYTEIWDRYVLMAEKNGVDATCQVLDREAMKLREKREKAADIEVVDFSQNGHAGKE